MNKTDYFISKFEAIPEDKWHTGNYCNADETQFCALGHCGARLLTIDAVTTAENTEESQTLGDLFFRYGLLVSYINDGRDPRYQQPTPKLRILQALYDIKRQQEEAAEAFELRPLNLSKAEKEASCVQV